jgi:hypothetical protein
MEVTSQDKQVNIEINTLIDENVTKNEKKNRFLNKFFKKNKNSIELINKKEEVVVVEEEGVLIEEEERVRWDSFTEYFLSIIGFVIDLGNVWRFPTVSYFKF